ncbi:hypothetical protein NDU88_005100 [Pleurodeles waltl]|uniref:Uncharacterized protein n=1 Tax=Pleurodeles waltl TaxID=8319 RepID=A0AAV7RK39_PLEWA|nr:hypothetical protein NDU88_005100 [Pleurodeles waltl]
MALSDQLFLRVALSCYHRSLRFAGGGAILFAPALALLGTPCGSIVKSGSELRAWHTVELHTLGDLYDDGNQWTPAWIAEWEAYTVMLHRECIPNVFGVWVELEWGLLALEREYVDMEAKTDLEPDERLQFAALKQHLGEV